MDLRADRQYTRQGRPAARAEATLQPRLISLKDAAKACGISLGAFRQHVLPELESVQLGARRLIRVSSLDHYLGSL